MTELIDQVSGYAQKMTWIFGIKCTVTVMYVIPYDAPGCKHDKHWHGRFSRTAHDTGDTVRKCQKAIEKCFYMCLSCRKFNNLRFIVKCRCKLRDRQKIRSHRQLLQAVSNR